MKFGITYKRNGVTEGNW